MQVLIFSPNKNLGTPLFKMFHQHGVHTELVAECKRAHYLAMTHFYSVIILVEAANCIHDLPSFYSDVTKEGCSSSWMFLTQNQSLTRADRLHQSGISVCHVLPCSYLRILEELYDIVRKVPGSSTQTVCSMRFRAELLSRSLFFDNTLLELTPRQFGILCYLIRKPGVAFSKAQIWDEVWGDAVYPTHNTIEVNVRRLRMKLPDPTIIETISGIGYRLRADC